MKRSTPFWCLFSVACAACGGGSTAAIDEADSSANDGASIPHEDGAPSTAGEAGGDGTVGANDASFDSAEALTGDASQGEDANEAEDAAVDGNAPDANQGSEEAGADGSGDTSTADDAGVDSSAPVVDASNLDASNEVDASEIDAGESEASDDADNGLDAGVDSGADGAIDSGIDAGADAAPPPAESLTVTTSGFGIVTASLGTLSCPTGCTTTFPRGTAVTLTATPSANQTFSHWAGACSGTSPTCDLTMSTATAVSAAFSETYPSAATPVTETYACTAATPLGTESLSLSVTFAGAPPTNVPPGATFSMAQFQVVGDVPASFTNAVTQYGYTSVSGQATTLDVASTDATHKTVNPAASAASAYKFGPIALTTGEGFTLSFPATPATIGTWSAPASNGAISFSPGEVVVTFSFAGGQFGTVDSTVTCPAPASPVTFATTSVP